MCCYTSIIEITIWYFKSYLFEISQYVFQKRIFVSSSDNLVEGKRKTRGTPTVPKTRETPTMSKTRETPTVPKTREKPTVPKTRETPTVPKTQETPTVPKTRETPTVSSSLPRSRRKQRNNRNFASAFKSLLPF